MEDILQFLFQHMLSLSVAAGSILLAAFFAAAETALVFANKQALQELAVDGNVRARTVLRLMEARERLHVVFLLLENCFIVLAAAVTTALAVQAFSTRPAVIAVTALVIGIVVIVFAKLAPKGLAARNPNRLALAVAFPAFVLLKLVSPLARLLAAVADFFAGPGTRRGVSCTAVVTEEDIKALINLGGEGGSLEAEEKALLHKVFEFGDTVASEAMRPRTEIVSVPSGATLHDLFVLLAEYGYSRYPVIENTVDTVVGILYAKDILMSLSRGELDRQETIQRFMRQAYFIPENKRVSELLSEMQRDKFHMAIVIDEYGGTSGIVTLEDLMEEIVGSIQDELDI
ncbi:MAG: hypothetical protein A2X57_12630, partial [Nitrospirae bacterium GWD2_57_8]